MIPKKFTDEQLEESMRECDGDARAASEYLSKINNENISREAVYRRVRSHPVLSKLYSNKKDQSSDVPDIVSEKDMALAKEVEQSNRQIVDQMLQTSESREMFFDSLRRAGIGEQIIDQVKAYASFDHHMPQMLGLSLVTTFAQLTHAQMRLAERERHIFENILKDGGTGETSRDWQRLHNQIIDLLQKGSDRMLRGTEALVKIQTMASGGSGESKPHTRTVRAQSMRDKPEEPLRS